MPRDDEEVTRVARSIDEAPQWVCDLLPSREERAASHAEAQAALEAVRRGDRSRVVSFEVLIAQLEEPGAEAV
jgi:hypothetical protein